PGSLLGSILYMPPEQLEDAKNIDFRADLYALGATLYHAISGTFPYDAENFWEVVVKIQREEPQPLSKVKPSIPPEIANVIMKSIYKRREDRFGSAAEFMNELQNLIRNNKNVYFSKPVESL